MGKASRSKMWGGIAMVLIICYLGTVAQGKYGGGLGEPNDPYRIATAEDLMLLGDNTEDYDKHFILTADIDLDPNLVGGRVFDRAVIAPDTNETGYGFQGTPFAGVFDGGGHKISHLMIEGDSYLGLFGRLVSGARIANLGLEAVDVNGIGACIGGLVGSNYYASIATTYSIGTVTGGVGGAVGGLVGENYYGNISTSYSTGRVIAGGYVGGLVGWNYHGSIATSHSTEMVAGTSTVGGLVGDNSGSISTSYSTGTTEGVSFVGGLAGENRGSITASYSTGTVSGTGNYVGGLAGNNTNGSISTSYSTATVCGRGSVGGLVGGNAWASVTTSYSIGAVTGEDNVGGLAGYNYHTTVTNNYSTGTVTGGERVGGLMGKTDSSTITMSYSISTVTGEGYYVGGLVGENDYGSIATSYSVGTVTGKGVVGGLVGGNAWTSITTSYSNGVVTGEDNVGGLAGYNYHTDVTNCYSSGMVSGTGQYVGGLIGRIVYGGVTTSSFWDVEASRQLTSASGTGRTTVEMKMLSSFTDAGWDFTDTWHICEDISYPRLQRQILPADLTCPYGVTMLDFFILARAWQSIPTDENWDSDCDLDGDEHIGAGDLAIACEQWMEGM